MHDPAGPLLAPVPGLDGEAAPEAWAQALLDRAGDALHLPVTGHRVPGTVAVALLAGAASLAASSYFVPNHLSLAYGDALAHLTAARNLFDAPGGLAAPPLPTLLLAPFVMGVWLWSSG